MKNLKNFYESYVKAANDRDFETISNLIHDEVYINGVLSKKEDAINGLVWLIDIVPDYKWDIEDLFINDDRIAARLKDSGTPSKDFFGNKPTGKSIVFTEFASYKVRKGKFVEMWYLIDVAKITQQLNNKQ